MLRGPPRNDDGSSIGVPSVGGCEGLLCAAGGEFGAFVALQA